MQFPVFVDDSWWLRLIVINCAHLQDHANRKSNQQNLGTIHCSNLCSEIIEYTSPDEVAVCNLAPQQLIGHIVANVVSGQLGLPDWSILGVLRSRVEICWNHAVAGILEAPCLETLPLICLESLSWSPLIEASLALPAFASADGKATFGFLILGIINWWLLLLEFMVVIIISKYESLRFHSIIHRSRFHGFNTSGYGKPVEIRAEDEATRWPQPVVV